MTLGFCKFAKYLPDSKNKFKLHNQGLKYPAAQIRLTKVSKNF